MCSIKLPTNWHIYLYVYLLTSAHCIEIVSSWSAGILIEDLFSGEGKKERQSSLWRWMVMNSWFELMQKVLLSSSKRQSNCRPGIKGPVCFVPCQATRSPGMHRSPRRPKSDAWERCLRQACFPGWKANRPQMHATQQHQRIYKPGKMQMTIKTQQGSSNW